VESNELRWRKHPSGTKMRKASARCRCFNHVIIISSPIFAINRSMFNLLVNSFLPPKSSTYTGVAKIVLLFDCYSHWAFRHPPSLEGRTAAFYKKPFCNGIALQTGWWNLHPKPFLENGRPCCFLFQARHFGHQFRKVATEAHATQQAYLWQSKICGGYALSIGNVLRPRVSTRHHSRYTSSSRRWSILALRRAKRSSEM